MRESVMHNIHNSGINILELFPFVTFSCPEDNSCYAGAIVMKFHQWTEYNERKHHAEGT